MRVERVVAKRDIRIGGTLFNLILKKSFHDSRLIDRMTMKREIAEYCKVRKVSMGSLRRRCNGPTSLAKLYELCQ